MAAAAFAGISQTVAAGPVRPVAGQAKTSDGSVPAKSASNATATKEGLRHFRIIGDRCNKRLRPGVRSGADFTRLARDRGAQLAKLLGAIETNISESTKQRDTKREKEPVEFPESSIPLTDGKAGTAHQVAQLVLFLVSDASSHISGTEIWMDGAQSLLQG